MNTTTNVKTIDVSANEWFDKVNGNSYFSVRVIINWQMEGEQSFNIPFQYGYGSQYQFETLKALQGKGILDKKYHSLWTACDDENIVLRTQKHENCKKRELYGGLKSHNAKY